MANKVWLFVEILFEILTPANVAPPRLVSNHTLGVNFSKQFVDIKLYNSLGWHLHPKFTGD